jgi:hypothetical protein
VFGPQQSPCSNQDSSLEFRMGIGVMRIPGDSLGHAKRCPPAWGMGSAEWDVELNRYAVGFGAFLDLLIHRME